MFCAVWRDHVLRQSEARTVDDVKAWLEREGYTYLGQPKRAGMNLEFVRICDDVDRSVDRSTAT